MKLGLEENVKVVPKKVEMAIPRTAIGEQRYRGSEMSNMFDVLEDMMLERQGGTRLCLMVAEHIERELLRDVSIKQGKR